MKQVSNAYKQAMSKRIRDHSYMVVSIGIISAEAQTDAKITSVTHHASDNTHLFTDSVVTNTYATLEENVFKADGSLVFMPEDTEYPQLIDGVSALGKDVLGSITIGFDKPYNIKGLTIDFGEYYPTEYTITTNNGTPITYQGTSNIHEDEASRDNVTSITITPISFVNGNNKRLRINAMKMGIGIVFQNEDIESASLNDSASFISEELPQINFNITCFDKNKRFNVDDNSSFVNYLAIGQEIVTTIGMELEDGSIEWVKMPLTYLSTWSSDSNKIAFQSMDRFAFLTQKYSEGNTIHSRTLYDDALAVLTYAGLEPDEYEIDRYLRTITVTNPMPEVSVAECLQLIANAGRCSLRQDLDGRIVLSANFENILEPVDVEIESNTHTTWSKPQNITVGSNAVYGDMTQNFLVADGSMFFLPETTSGQLLETGYVSKQIADIDGNFANNLLPTPYCGDRIQSGITFTYNNDGSVHAKGTCAADTWYYFHSNGGYNPWMASECPWELGDVVQFDFFIEGDVNGTIGITSGYKVSGDGANQGYIAYRAQGFNMTNGKVRFTDVKRQTIDPTERTGQYLTAYIYVKKGCVIDATISPMLTKREHLDEILVGRQDRFYRSAVNNVWTHNGVTYTLNDDGSILVNGTADGESVCEVINPYSASTRLTFVENHRYVLSEGRDTPIDTYHYSPFLQLVRYNTDTETSDYSITTRSHSNNTEFTATDANMMTYGLRIIVSNGRTADNVLLRPSLIDLDDYDATEKVYSSYIVGERPNLTMKLPTAYSYYSMKFEFEGNPPSEMDVTSYRNGEVINTAHCTDVTKEYILYSEFYEFDKLKLDFVKGSPNDRILLRKVTFGDLTDYRVEKQGMFQNPIGVVEPKTMSMSVRIFTFENDGDNPPKMVDDSEFCKINLGSVGNSVTFENQLISTYEHAEMIAKWLGNYYLNNISYSVEYRGEPRLEALDYIFLDSDILNNLQVEIESLSLEFNGALSGTLELRRAFNLIGE